MAIPPEEPVVLVRTGAVFQAIFFPKREHVHIVHIEYPGEIGVGVEDNAEEIKCFPFHPVCSRPERGNRWYVRITDWEKYLYPDQEIFPPVVEVVHHTQFPVFFFGEVYSTECCQKVELQFLVVAKKLQKLVYVLACRLNSNHAIGGNFTPQKHTRTFLFDAGMYKIVFHSFKQSDIFPGGAGIQVNNAGVAVRFSRVPEFSSPHL